MNKNFKKKFTSYKIQRTKYKPFKKMKLKTIGKKANKIASS